MSPRTFVLFRIRDVSGVSGTGVVAEGVQFSNGRVCLCWISNGKSSLAMHDNIASVETIHGHNGATIVEWLDERERPATT
jgi:hypothetical protein